ncbi:anthranilate phosphoribosyltransferase [Alkalilimnicola sp. S0819]|uniref:anthranilate phosphoribosyltransferase n=1 Tax=Alkalilimnicola sp. S0819 TaxID=2613922 RepID=UPI0012623DC2|nr:anthranilate phosphoribosyltransferase [Alkalilimnicola sp. S0819]KAB7628155.1 anthranilate phosphoribosyltransferase [Alkalilimnicola sp. S0819]MPQ15041.1 anthranilate phosphoribosyltransferase [Alkalilimnicola sp. S0819]
MDIQTAIRTVTEGRSLDQEDMGTVMRAIMTGECTPAQIGGFLIGLRMKGETVDEIAAAARVMRELASAVEVSKQHLLDTCGTGGDSRGTFNVSTATAFVAAAAGAKVAKHGNRSVSSRSGSADVLEAAGVNLDLTPEQVAQAIEEVGVGFLFAPRHHGAMRHAVGPRREMAVRTIFNLLGPITNPAGAPHQLLGVFDGRWVRPVAEVLRELGSRRVLVVHSDDGLDEISIGAATSVAELDQGEVREYRIAPEDFGMERADLDTVRVHSAEESLAMIRDVYQGEPGPAYDMVALNAGAAIYAAERADSLSHGVERARELLDDGSAGRKLAEYADFTRRLNPSV